MSILSMQAFNDFGPEEQAKLIEAKEKSYIIGPIWGPVSVEGKKYGFIIELTGEEALEQNNRYNLGLTFNCSAKGVEIDTNDKAKVKESPEFGSFTGPDKFFDIKVVE